MGHLDARNPRLPRLQLMEPSDLSLLVTLDALLQEGSVTGAARRVGLSTPAMSHALARIRIRLGDPILVRSGRGMLLTPRAEALRSEVHRVVNDARATLAVGRPFVASELTRTFVVHASDYVLTILGAEVDRLLRAEAPGVCLRFVPNTPDDAAQLRDRGADLAVGIYGDLPQEMRSRQLLTDRFVCVVRREHPVVARRLTLAQYASLPHLQIAPRGKPGGYIDDVLRERGLTRTVARAVPYFLTALQLLARDGLCAHHLRAPRPTLRRAPGARGPGGTAAAAALRAEPAVAPALDADEAHRLLARRVRARRTRGRRRAPRGAAHTPRHLGPHLAARPASGPSASGL
jgi:DNA-binding transcriptional LysR family regulator